MVAWCVRWKAPRRKRVIVFTSMMLVGLAGAMFRQSLRILGEHTKLSKSSQKNSANTVIKNFGASVGNGEGRTPRRISDPPSNMDRLPDIKDSNHLSTAGNEKEKKAKDITVFYHTFINHINEREGWNILIEQVKTMLNSPIIDRIKAIKYTTIHTPLTLPDCPICQNLGHYEEGFELKTHQKMFEYCENHPDERVIYIHSKGTYHPCEMNEVLRKAFMRSVFSEECHTQASGFGCNTCGFRYSPFPHPHFPGNFFAAECEYIRKLTPPSLAQERITEATYKVVGLHAEEAEDISRAFHGIGRYSPEFWVASHPDLIPCDVYEGPFTFGYENLPDNPTQFPINLKGPLRYPLAFYRNMNIEGPLNHSNPYECAATLHRFQEVLHGRGFAPNSWIHKAYIDDEKTKDAPRRYECSTKFGVYGGSTKRISFKCLNC
ncbi:hypothetical protein AAMO2058_000643900 [Amorphochlora amoebiformis]